MTVPTIVLLLVGGAVTDRFDRRRVMLAADLIRGVAVGCSRVLALTDGLEFWHIVALCAVYGAGDGVLQSGLRRDRAGPASGIDDLAQANALDQLVRPIAFRLAGPALGGWLVARIGAGSAFALDAATFVVSAVGVRSMRYRRPDGAHSAASIVHEIREGFAFVRARVWLWGTLVSAAFAYLAFMGPAEVLLPFVVKNDLGGAPPRSAWCSPPAASARSSAPSSGADGDCHGATSPRCTSSGRSRRCRSRATGSRSRAGS